MSGYGHDDYGLLGYGDAAVYETVSLLSAVVVATTNVKLTWTKVDAASAYEIHWAHTAGSPFTVKGATGPGGGTFTATELLPGLVYDFRVRVRGADANEDQGSNEIQIQMPGSAASTETPTVHNLTPANTAPIARGQVVSFDVQDDNALALLVVNVTFDGITEVAYDGTSFRGRFTDPRCSVSSTSGSTHVALIPEGGWPSPPTIEIVAVDNQGGVS